jgi:putative Mg2+ transporter-C (MgtC) family protein
MSVAQIILRLVVALGCGAVIGAEREREDRPAGFRTNTLVTVGAALFTVLSITAFPGSETSRVAAQIVVGIGFIGAGVIILHGGTLVVGLTTAATLWASAAIGMAAGAGLLRASAYSTALMLGVLIGFRWIENGVIARFQKKRIFFTIRACCDRDVRTEILRLLGIRAPGTRLIHYGEARGEVELRFRAQVLASQDLFEMAEQLREIEGIEFVGWEE